MSRPTTPGFSLRRQPLASTSSAGASRAATPLASRGISLEEWERSAPLSDEQLQSVSRIKDAFGQRPLPQKFAKTSGPSTPTVKPRQLAAFFTPDPSLPSSPAGHSPGPSHSAAVSNAIVDPLRPTVIVTPQQFHDHFTALTLSTEHEQDSLYRDHLAEIAGLRDKCDGLIGVLGESEKEVGEMLRALEYVEERSESLRGACEDLLEEQTHLLTHTSQLAHRLTFFTSLESAQRMLNNPGGNLVLSPDFLPMVQRLDECIGYLSEHRDFKDSEVYLMRYQQCMTRSMALVRLHFVASIKALAQEVGKRLTDRSLSETASQGLLYNRFSTLSSSLRPLIAELEQRTRVNKDELPQILADCHAAWVQARQTLVGPRVAQEVGRMNPGRSDLVDLTRAGCSYLKQTCMDEFHLYKMFFLSGETQLYGFLESLCDHLYDHIRPRILHEGSLSVLCEVCTVLQALMVSDIPDADVDPDAADSDGEGSVIYTPDSTPGLSSSPALHDADYFSSPAPSRLLTPAGSQPRRQSSFASHRFSPSVRSGQTKKRRRRRPLAKLHTEHLLKMVLQDAQTRLVFRAQALIQADVQYFVPKPADLDYPEKLGRTEKGRPLVERQLSVSLDAEDDDEPAFLSLPPPAAQETWYPALRSTLWVLSCLYTYVDNAVFEDLAQEAISTCRRSLTAASDLIAAKKDKTVDGRLFLVRHLLILKEMTAGLDLGRSNRQRDWAGITDFLRSLLENASSLLGYGRGSIVRAAEFAPDAKIDLDRELKRACEELIALCTQTATAPLRVFLDRCTAYLARVGDATASLSSQTWATPAEIAAVHAAFKDTARAALDAWVARLADYLQDQDTVRVLVPPAQTAITDTFRQFHDLVRAEYDFATAAALMTPSAVMGLLTRE
ncbi:Golgi transport complex subunit 3 [Cryptotrichosporon argae]